MGLQVEHDLEPMLGLAQKSVGILEYLVLLGGQAADLFQRLHGEQSVPLPNLRQVAAVEELEKLNGKLDVPDAAVAGLDFLITDSGPTDLLFDAPLERLDLVDFRETQVLSVYERFDGLEELLTQVQAAGDGPKLDQCLPFPGSTERVVIGKRAGQGSRQGTSMP